MRKITLVRVPLSVFYTQPKSKWDFSRFNLLLCALILLVLVVCLAACTRKIEPNQAAEGTDARAKACIDAGGYWLNETSGAHAICLYVQ